MKKIIYHVSFTYLNGAEKVKKKKTRHYFNIFRTKYIRLWPCYLYIFIIYGVSRLLIFLYYELTLDTYDFIFETLDTPNTSNPVVAGRNLILVLNSFY